MKTFANKKIALKEIRGTNLFFHDRGKKFTHKRYVAATFQEIKQLKQIDDEQRNKCY